MNSTVIWVLAWAALGISPAFAAAADPGALAAAGAAITNFRVVSPDIYRGARPEQAGIEALARLGVKTDLNIDNDDEAAAAEQRYADAAGIRMIDKPMSGFWSPNDAEVDEILGILSDSANYPIYVHCLHGQDRTGLIVGLFRVFYQGWTPAAAYQEMLDDGFHTELFLLNHYFEERTGFED